MCVKKNDIDNKETIEQLFNFYEEELYSNTDENRAFVKEILEIEKPFYESLTDNQKKAFEELVDLRSLNGAVTDKKIFVFAFSLAMKLVLESNIKI